ncbi:hypothetical protein [Algoriphagus terrigena]|uniref:hypothetical protein n=1 Tax=Algoriphagus terrigena TaxID=344884 RepID=UPI00042A7BE8|nr:hypothetical protein [Algoriphagus terrigena]
MIRNYYYFVVGLLAILFAFTHAWNGHSVLFPLVEALTVEQSLKTSFFYIWHIISVENLIFGIAFLIMSVDRDFAKVRFTARMMIFIMVARWLVIAVTTISKNRDEISGILVDSLAIFLLVGLIFLGTTRRQSHFYLKGQGKENK